MNRKEIYAATPIFQSPKLNARLGMTVHFKMDCHQPTRSFKLRGMTHLVRHHVARGQNRFVCASGGNAGYALAYASARLGAAVHVVVPVTTNARMRALIEGEGATVQTHGESWAEAHTLAQALAAAEGATYVPPFDDPLLWGGHASMIDECAAEIDEPDWVVASVGGGGLLCGIMEGMERNGWKKAAFLAAETHGAASFAAALKAGKPVAIDRIDSIATSLGAKLVADEAFAWSTRRHVESFLCTDRQTVEGMKSVGDAFQVIVEPACGAALAAAFTPAPQFSAGSKILVIVCGGATIDSEGFARLIKDLEP